jgi:hypothetical protein
MAENLNQLIQGLQKDNPRLYEAFKAISADLAKINATLYPFIASTTELIRDIPVAPPTGVTYTILPRSLVISWNASENAAGYEIRSVAHGEEEHEEPVLAWNEAQFVARTSSLSIAINPIETGEFHYLVKAISRGGNLSTLFTEVIVIINRPTSVNITSSVIDNNVMLRWTNSVTEFQLDYYVVQKDGVEIGRLNGTFISIFENTSGEFQYSVYAVDVAGNTSIPSTIVVAVSQPPDFVLESELESDLDGTLVDVKRETSPQNQLLVSVPTGRTWAEHFTDNTWDTIQDQLDAGFPIYAQPADTSGSAELEFDFGAIFENVIINTFWSEEALDGDVSVTAEIKYSDDDITYTAYVSGSTLFATSLRYVKVKLTFTGDDTNSLSLIFDVMCSISVKREMDGGTVEVLAADTGGTEVDFNKAFKDVETITVTPLSTVEQVAIYDFVDDPNPTSFFILLFDDTGARVDGVVSWKARGIL